MNSLAVSPFNDSIYIPITMELNELHLGELFMAACIGSVKRVDFIVSPSTGKTGAFVHFNYWYDNPVVTAMWQSIAEQGSSRFYFQDCGCGEDYRFRVFGEEGIRKFLIIRRMTCSVVPETEMNIHQVAAKLAEQAERIAELEQFVSELVEQDVSQDKNMQRMVDSLVGPSLADDYDAGFPVLSDDEIDLDMEDAMDILQFGTGDQSAYF